MNSETEPEIGNLKAHRVFYKRYVTFCIMDLRVY